MVSMKWCWALGTAALLLLALVSGARVATAKYPGDSFSAGAQVAPQRDSRWVNVVIAQATARTQAAPAIPTDEWGATETAIARLTATAEARTATAEARLTATAEAEATSAAGTAIAAATQTAIAAGTQTAIAGLTATAGARLTLTAIASMSVTPTYTPTPVQAACGPLSDYSVVTSGDGTPVAGITDTGNHCDDCTSPVTLPFIYNLYGQPFTTANVSSNGTLQFSSNNAAANNSCLPAAGFSNTIFAHWDDLRTDNPPPGHAGCAWYPGGECGIFTAEIGAAPNRVFAIEWRAVYDNNLAQRAHFTVLLYEGRNQAQVVYTRAEQGGSGATVGMQDTNRFTRFSCDVPGALYPGLRLTFTLPECTCTAAPPNMVVWLPGDGNATDLSGNGNHGTLQGGATYTPGVVNQAFSFDGTDDYVQSAMTNTLMNNLPLTIDAWVKPELRTDGTDFPINAVSNDRPYFYGHGFGLNVYPGGSQLKVEYHDGGRVMTGMQFGADRWYHIAIVYTSGNVKTYVNGNLADNFSYAQGAVDGSQLFLIGKHNDDAAQYGTRRFFKGAIDEVELFNRALSAAEVRSIYNAGSAGKCRPGTPTATPTPDCNLRWRQVPNPNRGTGTNELNGVAALSANDMWAVGSAQGITRTETLVQYWNGTNWTIVNSPNPGAGDHVLNAVAALAPNDVWAVGYYQPTAGGAKQTLILHYDGASWIRIGSPNGAGLNSELNAISALDTDEIWAVGGSTGTVWGPLSLRWNGTVWSVVPTPGQAILRGVAAISPNEAWAVGDAIAGAMPLILYWNGSAWAQRSSPQAGDLTAISARASNDVWAVGRRYAERTFALHWDGGQWTAMDLPCYGYPYCDPTAVIALAANDVWAVADDPSLLSPLMFHWNGTAWARDQWYYTNQRRILHAVAATSPTDLWAVGSFYEVYGSPLQTLVARYHNPCGSPPPPPPSPCAPPAGMNAWLTGDGNATDLSGNGNHGALQQGATYASGMVNQAFSFDGLGAHVQSAMTNTLMNTLPLTIDAWVKPELRFDGSQFYANAISNEQPGQYGHGFGLNVWSGGSQLSVMYQNGFRIVPGSFAAGQWYHIAVVYTSGNVTTYVNGAQRDSFSYTQGALDGADVFRIGKENDVTQNGTRRFFKGLIDEVEIFNRALSAYEIVDIFQAAAAGRCRPAEWVLRRYVPRAVYGPAVTGDGTYVYAAGGYSFQLGRVSNLFARYDLASNRWTALPPLPVPADSAAAVYAPVNNKIYVFGGIDGAGSVGTVLTTTRVYNIISGTWSLAAPMPAPRQLMAAGYYTPTNKILLVGGFSGPDISSAAAQTWEYDPVANTWNTARANLPQALGGAGAGLINGQLYLAGGRDANNTLLDTLYAYSVVSNTWSTRTKMPTALNAPGTAVSAGRLVLFGGGTPYFGPMEQEPPPGAPAGPPTGNNTLVYQPASDSWHQEPPINIGRSLIGGASVAAGIVAVGGYNGSTSVDTVEVRAHYGMMTGTPTPTPGTTTPTLTPSPVTTTYANNTPASIPDNATATSTITVPDAGFAPQAPVITSIEVVGLTFNHPAADNLDVHLISPAGTRVELFTDICGATAWATATTGFSLSDSAAPLIGSTCPPLAGTYRPEGALAALLGEDPAGVWTLEVRDDQIGGTGTINGWGLRITRCDDCPTPTPSHTPTETPTETSTPTPTYTATRTPTRTPVYSSCASPIPGSLVGAPTQTGRLERDSVPAACAAPKSCPAVIGPAGIRYKTYYFNNTNADAICVTISVSTSTLCGTRLQSSAYAHLYEPTDRCSYYLGDSGGSNNTMVYSVVLPGLTNLVVVVNETAPGICNDSYSLAVTGLSPACPTLTPLPTASPTVTNTPICGVRSWTYQAPYPIDIMDQAVTSHDGKLYSFGGVSSGIFVNNSYVYDPAANTWTAIAPLPAFREQAAATSDGTYIYIMGGSDSTGAHQTTNYRYDPVANTYTTQAALSLGVRAAAAVYLSGKVYRIGGIGAGHVFTSTAAVYTVATNSWSPIASYPQAAGYLHAVALNGSIYAAGGAGPTTDLVETYRYDTGTNVWIDADIAQLPAPRWGAASGVVNGHWVLAGGSVNGAISNDGRAWNPGTNTWLLIDAQLQPRLRGNSGVAAGALFHVGGSDPPFAFFGTADNQRYRATCLNTPTATVTPTGQTATPTGTPTGTRTATAMPTNTRTATLTRTKTSGISLPGNRGTRHRACPWIRRPLQTPLL